MTTAAHSFLIILLGTLRFLDSSKHAACRQTINLFAQVLDPQTGELSHVFVHSSCSSKRVSAAAGGDAGAGTSLEKRSSGGELLMSKIQRQLLLQVLAAFVWSSTG
jgi:hypothetical protein